MKPDLNRRVLEMLRKIPRGKVTTYKELAIAANTGPRIIGRIMACNDQPQLYPCYKVIHTNGNIGGYSASGGEKKKSRLLRKDGIKITNGKVDKKYFWTFKKDK